MHPDDTAIRDIVARWVEAIRACDLDGVVAAHTDDVVMFDVPPPYDGIRGIDAYRRCWPEFFEFITAGACFELVELDVTAADTVAFVHGLLRCGMPGELEKNPDNRLRLTMGLRKVSGRWLIAHEHHSFPHTG